jgi:hypothetical protein
MYPAGLSGGTSRLRRDHHFMAGQLTWTYSTK